ncbi:MAG: polyprenyl synthetase family protein [Bacteroidales bacterium]|nr:polyprenyl synthetase family protein [Bacteroidales bacterium]
MYNHPQLKEVVDRAIVNLSYNTEAEKLIDPVKYVLSMGGKRLRPVLALMACNLFTDKIDDAILPATGLEVFHNFTLVHDDIMDQASLRRNYPTVHSKWNTSQAILSGDVMAFIANECILQTPASHLLRVFRVFNKAAVEVCVGQQLDMDYEKASFVSQEEYLRMIELKTAILFAASAKTGAIIGGADDKDSDLLYEFGKNLGLAFQLQDDLLDIYGDSKVFGKTLGGDIIANKKTFPYVNALERSAGKKLRELQNLFSDKESDPDTKVRAVMDIYDQLNIKAVTENLAAQYINLAFSVLDKVNVDQKRKCELVYIANSLIGREK